MKNKEVKYDGFEFSSPLFSYLGDYGSDEVMRSGKLHLNEVELGHEQKLGYRTISEDSTDDCR